MTRVRQRLEKLEARISDESRLQPHTPSWLAYWANWMKKYERGEKPPGRMPLEFARAVVRDEISID